MTTTSASPVGAEAAAGGSRPGRIVPKQRTPSEGTDSGGGGSSRETWISTNKILNSSLCGRRMNSRNPNFDYDETKLLISLWGDPQVQKTLITTHKKHPVIAELARKMREQGYNRSTEEINTRIKNLKCFYNRIKKDMAAGIINQTTWRHYAEMDEIISRPVFGNAHRIHLLQQQKQEERPNSTELAVRKSSRMVVNSDVGEGPCKEEDDLPIDQIHQFPVKLELMSDDDEDDEATEIRAEDLLTIDAKFPDDSLASADTGSVGAGKSGVGGRSFAGGKASNGRNGATNGRSAKQTDDDEDDEEDDEDDEEDDDEGSDFDVENEFNDGLDELLKAQAKGSSSIGPAAKSSFGLSATATTSKASNASGLVIETISSANGTTITATSSATTPSAPTTGKISVVPTNLLLKQPTVSTNMTRPIQLYTQPTVSLASSSMIGSMAASTVTTAGKGITPSNAAGGAFASNIAPSAVPNGVAPMKLLLVNTVAKDGTMKQILTPASEVPSMPQLLPAANFHQAKMPPALPGKTPVVSIPAVNMPPKPMMEAPKATPDGGNGARKSGQQSAGFKSLLTQLVAIQKENLVINQERLALEKERLEFEKQFGGSFVTMVRNMSTFFSGMLRHQRKELHPHDTQETSEAPVPEVEVEKRVDSKLPADKEGPLSPLPNEQSDPKGMENTAEVCETSTTPTSDSPLGDPLQPSPASLKRPLSDQAVEKPANRSPSHDPEPEITITSIRQNNGTQPTPTTDDSPPKKRRMMTRNSSQLSQVPESRVVSASSNDGEEEELKTEIISDNDER